MQKTLILQWILKGIESKKCPFGHFYLKFYFENNSTSLFAASFVSSGEPKVEKRK